MDNGRQIILPKKEEETHVLTASIGDHLVEKMIRTYEGSFAKGVVPSSIAIEKKFNNLQ